ncbi:MAG TPA: hypothetical protein VHX52_09950 [Steroidobacteraceae bacterium]|jgi:hypothetical protein|nr:hypothetical protein [Steroidobacteraceae bacterium]
MESSEVIRGTTLAVHPTLSWGAVFAGWFVATAVAATLYAFGLALGFSALNPYDTVAAASGAATGGSAAGAILWIILTWAGALFIGSIFASWFDGRNDTEMGVVRGLAVWGLSVTTTALVMSGGLTRFMYATAAAVPAASGIDRTALAHYTAQIMWIAFGSSIVALIASVFGGWLGAHHVHHVYHLRAYQPHLRR